MKHLISIALIFSIIIGCQEPEKVTNEKVTLEKKVERVKPAGPLVRLKYNFKPGDKFSYKLQTASNNTEEISADTTIKSEITQNATYRMNFKVKNIDDNKNANIEVRISSILAETIFNGQSVKYDSKFIYSTRERVQFADYEAVKKVPFLITVNEIGQVTNVDNISKIMKNLLEIQKIPDTLSAKTKEKMKLNIANGTLMPLTQQIFKVVSEKEVGVDSIWQLKYSTPLAVFNVENTAVFKITSLNLEQDTIANITSNLLINVVGNNIVQEQGVTYSFADPILNATGSVKYNNSKGLVEFSESVTKVEMMMYMEGVDKENKPLKSNKKDISNNTNTVELL